MIVVKYALKLKQDTYNLAVFLNNRRHLNLDTERASWLVFELGSTTDTINPIIQYEEDLRNEDGSLKEPMTFIS